MPIIKITQDAINKSKPPQAGWHKMRIEKFVETDSIDKKTKKGRKDWVFECPIIESSVDASNVGRYGYARFYSNATGFLLSTGFLPALYEKAIDEEFEFNPDELVGKEFWGEIKDDVYEGKPQKKLENFAPPSSTPF
jgi:hypothetical protein